MSCYLEVADSNLDFDDLAYRKERVGQSRVDDFAEIELGGETFALKPYGKYPYKFVLANEQMEIRLAENLRPGCYVQFYSNGLWLNGIDNLWGRFVDWCNGLKLYASRPENISRADWAFDYGIPIVDFEAKHFASRAAKNAVYSEHSKIQTIAFGKGDTVIRIYDKVAEIEQQSGKAFFYELWGQTEDVWRIEFQLRRERLKRAGINTIEDLNDYQNDVLRDIAQRHTTLRRPVSDRNKSRWPLHPLWKQLLADINRLPQTGLVEDFNPAAPLHWRVYQQGKSIHGMLKGLGVLLSLQDRLPDDPTLQDVLHKLNDVLKPHHNATIWNADIKKRQSAYRLGLW